MPPCHPAIPVPLAMVSSRPRNCSLLISLCVQIGHDEIGLPQQVRIEVDIERLADGDLEAVVPQDTREERRALVGLMPLPTARDQQCPFPPSVTLPCASRISVVSSAELDVRRNHHPRVGRRATVGRLAYQPRYDNRGRRSG